MALRVIFILLFAFLVYYCIYMVVSELGEKIKQTYSAFELEDENRKRLKLEDENRKRLKLEEEIRKHVKLALEEENRKTWLSKFWS